MQRKKTTATRKFSEVDPSVAIPLEKIFKKKIVVEVDRGATVYAQGDLADCVYFIETGRVKISIVSAQGKEAVLRMLAAGDFLGEGCLASQSLRVSTATAIESSKLLRIEKRAMINALHSQPEFSGRFVSSLLVRAINIEEDICDQLFNHSEKRLARVLLKLAHVAQQGAPRPTATLEAVSHQVLAEMVGTTRSRVTHFMNQFRKQGLIDYDGKTITVRPALLIDLILPDLKCALS